MQLKESTLCINSQNYSSTNLTQTECELSMRMEDGNSAEYAEQRNKSPSACLFSIPSLPFPGWSILQRARIVAF